MLVMVMVQTPILKLAINHDWKKAIQCNHDFAINSIKITINLKFHVQWCSMFNVCITINLNML